MTSRDPEANYHKMNRAQFQELTPHFSWTEYFGEIGRLGVDEINVAQPDFFKEVDRCSALKLLVMSDLSS